MAAIARVGQDPPPYHAHSLSKVEKRNISIAVIACYALTLLSLIGFGLAGCFHAGPLGPSPDSSFIMTIVFGANAVVLAINTVRWASRRPNFFPKASRNTITGIGFSAIITLSLMGLGLAGCFHAGPLGHLLKCSIALTVVFGISAVVSVISLIFFTRVYPVENRRSLLIDNASNKILPPELINLVEVYAGPVSRYGKDEWKFFDIEVVGEVPDLPPNTDLNGRIALFMPQRVKFGGVEQDFGPKVLEKITNDTFKIGHPLSPDIGYSKHNLGKWVLIDKAVIPENVELEYEIQREMAEKSDHEVARAIEVITLALMVYAITEERLYHNASVRCCDDYADNPMLAHIPNPPILVHFPDHPYHVSIQHDNARKEAGLIRVKRINPPF